MLIKCYTLSPTWRIIRILGHVGMLAGYYCIRIDVKNLLG